MKIQSPIAPPLLLGLMAPTYLIVHHWGRDCVNAWIKTGIWSEEIFRGDRLPALPFPEQKPSQQSDPSHQ